MKKELQTKDSLNLSDNPVKISSIIRNGSLYILGNIFNKAVAFVTVPIFTRLLTTEEYGVVNTYTSWVALMAVIVGLSMGSSIRNAYVDLNKELGNYISSIFTLAGLNFAIICILYTCIARYINLPKSLVWFCLIESFFNFVINSVVVRYVIEEKAFKRTALLILPNLTGAVLSILLIHMMKKDRYYGRIIAACIMTTVFGLAIMLYYMLRYKTFFNKRFWKYALSISIPLVLHGISCNILGTSDRSVITYYCGTAETGIYSLIYNLSMVSGVLTASAESVWIPRFIRGMAKKDYKMVNRETLCYVYIVLFGFCGILTIAPELVLVLGGEKYFSGMKMIFPIVASSFVMFLYGIYVNVEFFYKKTSMIAVTTFVAAGLNLVLNFIFVPTFGAIAAAYTTLASYMASFVLHSLNAKRIDKKVMPYDCLLLPVLIVLLSGIITNLTVDMMVLRWGIMITLGSIYVVLAWRNLCWKGNNKRNETVD